MSPCNVGSYSAVYWQTKSRKPQKCIIPRQKLYSKNRQLFSFKISSVIPFAKHVSACNFKEIIVSLKSKHLKTKEKPCNFNSYTALLFSLHCQKMYPVSSTHKPAKRLRVEKEEQRDERTLAFCKKNRASNMQLAPMRQPKIRPWTQRSGSRAKAKKFLPECSFRCKAETERWQEFLSWWPGGDSNPGPTA